MCFFLEFDKSWNESFELTACQSESYRFYISQLRSGDETHVLFASIAVPLMCNQTLLYCRQYT